MTTATDLRHRVAVAVAKLQVLERRTAAGLEGKAMWRCVHRTGSHWVPHGETCFLQRTERG